MALSERGAGRAFELNASLAVIGCALALLHPRVRETTAALVPNVEDTPPA